MHTAAHSKVNATANPVSPMSNPQTASQWRAKPDTAPATPTAPRKRAPAYQRNATRSFGMCAPCPVNHRAAIEPNGPPSQACAVCASRVLTAQPRSPPTDVLRAASHAYVQPTTPPRPRQLSLPTPWTPHTAPLPGGERGPSLTPPLSRGERENCAPHPGPLPKGEGEPSLTPTLSSGERECAEGAARVPPPFGRGIGGGRSGRDGRGGCPASHE